MKKLFGFLALAAVVGGAFVVLRKPADAMPPPPSQLVRIICDGANACCNGTGNTSAGVREFVYNVQVPGGGLVSVSSIEVGTHVDNNLGDYTNLVMPAGWGLTILPAAPPCADLHCTPHGGLSSIAANCNYVLRFSGPAKTSGFTLAYNFTPNYDIHDVEWKASNGNKARWNYPVGLGNGPIHAPWDQ